MRRDPHVEITGHGCLLWATIFLTAYGVVAFIGDVWDFVT